jgi:hypothetical protein
MSVGSHVQQNRDSGMINILPSAVHSQALREFGQLVPKAAAAAQRRAINKTLGWLRTHIARAVGKQERIAIGTVRQRLRAYPVSGGAMRGKLWFGVNAIEASRIGRPRQSRTGVSVAGRQYQGAFFTQVYGSSPDIWIWRRHAEHLTGICSIPFAIISMAIWRAVSRQCWRPTRAWRMRISLTVLAW